MIAFGNAKTIAVFDVDETIIPMKSMFSFLEFAMKAKMGPDEGVRSYDTFYSEIKTYRASLSRETVNSMFYRVFRDWDLNDLSVLAKRWWDQIPPNARWINETLSALKIHQDAGHPIVLLSGSADFILKPVAEALSADITLAIQLGKTNEGACSGEIVGIQTIGYGKREALMQLECLLEVDAKIVGYGDHVSDLAFLDYCDEAYVIVPNGSQIPDWTHGLSILYSATQQGAKPSHHAANRTH